jgi:hypothetical protein
VTTVIRISAFCHDGAGFRVADRENCRHGAARARPDGGFCLDLRYFYHHDLAMTNGRFDDLFSRPPRLPESAVQQRHA